MNLDNLNESQKKAVTYEGQHLLVLAGAGTGKTKTIIARAAYLIDKGVHPGKIQILTFTKRASNEIVSRVKSSLGSNQAGTLRGSTFHSWCNYLLTRFPNLFGTTSFTIIDQDDQVSIMKMVCGGKSLEYEKIRIKPQKLVDLYSFARNTKRNLTETIRLKLFNDLSDKATEESIQKIKPDIAVILKAYENKKRERHYLDYDDMLQIVATRLKKDEQAREIIASHYDHLLVDEMQDTNPLQWELLNPFQHICHLFCVGDDAQSIYSFRGADFKNVHAFTDRVKHAEILKLQDNYRSTQQILDLSNWLLEESPIRYNKKLRSVRGDGVLPRILNVQSEWEEAYWIADQIIENYTKKNKIYHDHLVLTRTQYYARTLEAVFIERKIPYITYGGRKFMEAAHIKDLMSALRVVNNYYDEIAWMRFMMLWEGIGEITASRNILALLELENIRMGVRYLQEKPSLTKNQQIPKILTAIDENRSDVRKAVSRAIELIRDRLAIKYKEDWEKKRKGDFPVLEVLANKYASLGEFIAECTLDASNKISDSPTLASSDLERTENKDHVVISTVHSAKGLEADVCYVLNVSPKAYPSSWSLGNQDEIEEDRRVLYVALTRAKNELILTRKTSSIYAENKKKLPRRHVDAATEEELKEEQYFLNGLPLNLVEQISTSSESARVRDLDEPNPLDFDFGLDFD